MTRIKKTEEKKTREEVRDRARPHQTQEGEHSSGAACGRPIATDKRGERGVGGRLLGVSVRAHCARWKSGRRDGGVKDGACDLLLLPLLFTAADRRELPESSSPGAGPRARTHARTRRQSCRKAGSVACQRVTGLLPGAERGRWDGGGGGGIDVVPHEKKVHERKILIGFVKSGRAGEKISGAVVGEGVSSMLKPFFANYM